MKHIALFLAGLLLVFGLTACSGGGGSGSTSSGSSNWDQLKWDQDTWA